MGEAHVLEDQNPGLGSASHVDLGAASAALPRDRGTRPQ